MTENTKMEPREYSMGVKDIDWRLPFEEKLQKVREAYPNVNLERLRLWIEALRSGEYTQGKGMLERTTLEFSDDTVIGEITTGMAKSVVKTTHCCLGVLCDVAIKNGLDSLWVDRRDKKQVMAYGGRFDTAFGTSKAMSYLPPEVMEWIGFNDNNPTMIGKEERGCVNEYTYGRSIARQLSSWNDSHGWTFEDVANALEQTFFPEEWAAKQ